MMVVQRLDEQLSATGEAGNEPRSRFNSVVAGEIRDQILARARRRRWLKALRKSAVLGGGVILLGLLLGLAAGNRDKIAAYLSSLSPAKSIQATETRVLVPAGEFIYGDGARVNLNSFDIDRTEVTIAQYAEFLKAAGNRRDYDYPAQPIAKNGHTNPQWEALYRAASAGAEFQGVRVDGNFPAVFLDWFDAYAYAKWKGRRLPSEQEWEKAARGTDGRRFPWGSDESSKANTFEGDATRKWAAAGSFPGDRSPYGVFDMGGNVSEWTDTWDENRVVVRGGNFGNANAEITRRVIREEPSVLSDRIGFRTAGDVTR
jgi:formylglycine-generating enzyme required for sulfatase activity